MTTEKTVSKKKTTKRPTSKKKTSAKKTKASAGSTTARGRTIPLKKVCSDLGLTPSFAIREKLRRAWRNEDDARVRDEQHSLGDRWVFTEAEAKRAKEILAPKG